MKYAPRQFVHMLGIVAVLLFVLWGVDRWQQGRVSATADTVNVRQYLWLASMNVGSDDAVSHALIKSGDVAMLVARYDSDVSGLKAQHNLASDDGAVLALFHFDGNGNAVIDVRDPMYKKLFFLTYHHDQPHLRSLPQRHVRAIHVHRQGGKVGYEAIQPAGVRVPMVTAPQSRPYSPVLDR